MAANWVPAASRWQRPPPPSPAHPSTASPNDDFDQFDPIVCVILIMVASNEQQQQCARGNDCTAACVLKQGHRRDTHSFTHIQAFRRRSSSESGTNEQIFYSLSLLLFYLLSWIWIALLGNARAFLEHSSLWCHNKSPPHSVPLPLFNYSQLKKCRKFSGWADEFTIYKVASARVELFKKRCQVSHIKLTYFCGISRDNN